MHAFKRRKKRETHTSHTIPNDTQWKNNQSSIKYLTSFELKLFLMQRQNGLSAFRKLIFHVSKMRESQKIDLQCFGLEISGRIVFLISPISSHTNTTA